VDDGARFERLRRVRVMLVGTSHPGNVGAAARAMATMGLAQLVLVAPRCTLDERAHSMAAGAASLLDQMVLSPNLDAALAGTCFSVATTMRRRDLSHPVVDAREAAHRLWEASAGGEVALLFGREDRGLSNAEAERASLLATIPSAPSGGSLNVAQAVQVFAYELWLAAGAGIGEGARERAGYDEFERLLEHFHGVMLASGFLHPARPKRLMTRLRRMLARAELEPSEVNILRGFLKAVDPRNREDAAEPGSEAPLGTTPQ
jgi:tRNA/rRNA methyltransferase